MLLKTILNRIERYKGFVFEDIEMVFRGDAVERLEIKIQPRCGSRGTCSGCGRGCPGYDQLGERRFDYVPLWGIPVILVYCMRRVACPDCGVKVEWVPWATGKSPVSRSLASYLADWAKVLSWQEVSRRFGVNWRQVFESVCYAVDWGLAHRAHRKLRTRGCCRQYPHGNQGATGQ